MPKEGNNPLRLSRKMRVVIRMSTSVRCDWRRRHHTEDKPHEGEIGTKESAADLLNQQSPKIVDCSNKRMYRAIVGGKEMSGSIINE